MPFLKKTLSDVMVPVAQFPVVRAEDSVREAVRRLTKVFIQESGDESRVRTILVVDKDQNLVGILSFGKILKGLIPEALGKLSERVRMLGIAAAFAEAGFEELAEVRAEFAARVMREAEIQVMEIMTKVKRHVEVGTPLTEAIRLKFKEDLQVLPVYQGGRLVPSCINQSNVFLD